MSLHPAAWLFWLGGVAAYAALVSNPLALAVALGAVLVVAAARPRDPSAAGRAVRLMVLAGAVLGVLRLAAVATLPNPGRTTLAVLPSLRFAGLRLGGPVTAEVLVEGGVEALRLALVLAAFGVVNAAADLAGAVRMVPSAFRDAGLVVSIGLTFVPGLLAAAREVRDAQRLRGERGLRAVGPSLAVPVLGLTLERALLLAESMDARGYGRLPPPPSSRRAAGGGLAALAAGLALWTGGGRAAGSALVAGGAAALVASFVLAGRAAGETRLQRRPLRPRDAAVALGAALAAAGAALAPGASYSAFPVLAAPPFPAAAALASLGLLGPLAGARR